jgi:hypothetical protein
LRHLVFDRGGLLAAALAVPFLMAPLHENFRLANVYGLLLFCLTLGLVGLDRLGVATSGLGLGLAAGTKLSGSPVWLVLAARGRWRELALTVSVALLWMTLSVSLTGPASWARFGASLAEHANEPGWAAGLSFQTTPSFFQHLFRPDARWNPQPVWALPAWVARACTLLVSGAALGALLWRARASALDLAYGAAAALGVVVLPFAEEYHYVLLVLPFTVALGRYAQLEGARRWPAALWLAAAFALVAAPWPYKDPWLNEGWHALLGYPRLYGGWLLFAWLQWAMTRVAPASLRTMVFAPEPARG